MEMIVLVGPMGAGKSTAASFLANEYSGQVLSFTQAVFSPILGILDIEPTRSAFQGLGESLMAWPGEEALVHALLATWDHQRVAILDDVRYLRTLRLVSDKVTSASTLYIDCPDDIRYQRLSYRNGLSSWDDFATASARSTEQEIAALRHHAQYVVANDTEFDVFLDRLRRCFSAEGE